MTLGSVLADVASRQHRVIRRRIDLYRFCNMSQVADFVAANRYGLTVEWSFAGKSLDPVMIALR